MSKRQSIFSRSTDYDQFPLRLKFVRCGSHARLALALALALDLDCTLREPPLQMLQMLLLQLLRRATPGDCGAFVK